MFLCSKDARTSFQSKCLRGVQLTEHQYSFMNTTVLHVFNFKCLMFQIKHRQGVEPVFVFNICCIALNASLCSSLEHVLAFKVCSMKNIWASVWQKGSSNIKILNYFIGLNFKCKLAPYIFYIFKIIFFISNIYFSWFISLMVGWNREIDDSEVIMFLSH